MVENILKKEFNFQTFLHDIPFLLLFVFYSKFQSLGSLGVEVYIKRQFIWIEENPRLEQSKIVVIAETSCESVSQVNGKKLFKWNLVIIDEIQREYGWFSQM